MCVYEQPLGGCVCVSRACHSISHGEVRSGLKQSIVLDHRSIILQEEVKITGVTVFVNPYTEPDEEEEKEEAKNEKEVKDEEKVRLIFLEPLMSE